MMFPDHCIYRSGPKECAKGHDIYTLARPCNPDEIRRHGYGPNNPPPKYLAIFKRVPCIAGNNINSCVDFRLPTEDELAKRKAKTDAFVARFLERLVIVRPLIEADLERRQLVNKSAMGIIDCPICKSGKINYSYAGSVNGHISARCNTKDCIEWIE